MTLELSIYFNNIMNRYQSIKFQSINLKQNEKGRRQSGLKALKDTDLDD